MERISEYSSRAPSLDAALQVDTRKPTSPSARVPMLNQIEMLNNSTQSLSNREPPPSEDVARRKSASGFPSTLCHIGVTSVAKAIAFIGVMLAGVGAGVSVFATNSQNNAINTATIPTIADDALLATRWEGKTRAADNFPAGVKSRVYRDHNTLQARQDSQSAKVHSPYNFGLG